MRALLRILLLAAPLTASAQTADFDDASECTTAATSCTLSVTVASQSNRVMYALCAQNSAISRVTSVTFGGVPLTFLTGVAQGVGTEYLELWTLIGPAISTANLVCNYSTSIASSVGALTVYGADQITGIRGVLTETVETGEEADPISLTVTSVTGDLVALFAVVRSQTCTAYTGGTAMWDDKAITAGRVHCAGRYVASGALATGVIDLSAAALYGAIIISIPPASLSAGSGFPMLYQQMNGGF